MKMVGTMLITGCGGDIPQALARIARKEVLCERVIGTDMHDDHAGPAFFDDCYVIPRATDPSYFERLAELMSREKVSLLVVGSEPELHALAASGIDRVWERMPVIMANRVALRIGLDKLATAQVLEAAGLGAPWTQLVSDGNPPSYPCIIKGRRGSGSRSVGVLSNDAEFQRVSVTRKEDIVQEMLGTEDQEYTCGLYRSCAGEIRSLTFRRRLLGGFTGKGVVVEDSQIDGLLSAIAELLQLQGSVNVQLRMTKRGPVVFEINPRFSSTVMFRHLLGFQDFVWSVRETEGSPIGDYVAPAAGTRIYRASTEVILGGHTH
jgi:carbamoyl-phosphate synthase large subunit